MCLLRAIIASDGSFCVTCISNSVHVLTLSYISIVSLSRTFPKSWLDVYLLSLSLIIHSSGPFIGICVIISGSLFHLTTCGQQVKVGANNPRKSLTPVFAFSLGMHVDSSSAGFA